MNDETYLIGFKAICNFVNDLESVYGSSHKPLRLYKRLVSHTQISHDQAIRKHIGIFQDFCFSNRESFYTQNNLNLTKKKIEYSDRVFIDISTILEKSDTETTNIIWKHLLTISAIVDPAGKAKEILRKHKEEDKTSVDETDFLTNIISKVEQTVKPDANPMEAVSSILQSGIFTDMMSDLGSNKLDLGKLLGAVQGMVSKLGSQVGDDPQAQQTVGMINNMMGSMANGGQPDMSSMMQMMTSMMGSMQNNGNTIEDITEKKA